MQGITGACLPAPGRGGWKGGLRSGQSLLRITWIDSSGGKEPLKVSEPFKDSIT